MKTFLNSILRILKFFFFAADRSPGSGWWLGSFPIGSDWHTQRRIDVDASKVYEMHWLDQGHGLRLAQGRRQYRSCFLEGPEILGHSLEWEEGCKVDRKSFPQAQTPGRRVGGEGTALHETALRNPSLEAASRRSSPEGCCWCSNICSDCICSRHVVTIE